MYTTKNSMLETLTRLQNKNKSLIYMYKLMQLNCEEPINTYLGFNNFETDTTLIALYHTSETNIEKILKTATKSKYYGSHFTDNDGYVYIFYELFDISIAYDLIKEGNYSKLPSEFKRMLLAYKDPLIHYGLFPDDHFHQFAEEFEYPLKSIPKYNGNELIPPPNLESEYITAPKEVLQQLEEQFVLE